MIWAFFLFIFINMVSQLLFKVEILGGVRYKTGWGVALVKAGREA